MPGFIVSWLIPVQNPASPAAPAFILALVGVLMALITGWMGGELVERHRIGVDDDAGVNASSSLGEKKGRHVVE